MAVGYRLLVLNWAEGEIRVNGIWYTNSQSVLEYAWSRLPRHLGSNTPAA